MENLRGGILALASIAMAIDASAQTVSGGGPGAGSQSPATTASPNQVTQLLDFAKATELPLPIPKVGPNLGEAAAAPQTLFGAAGASPGFSGSGAQSSVKIAESKSISSQDIAPQEFGTSSLVFTTSQAAPTDNYPLRAAGKLFFKIGSSTYLCSASLIKPGIIVTAAHCVANFGAKSFYSGWQFIPAYRNGVAPYGVYTAQGAWVLTSYYAGTDSCASRGVVCKDDVAVLRLNKSNNSYAGTRAGWFGYGWNGYGFNSKSQTLISQLGYPVALDGGLLMERTDAQGQTTPSFSNNTVFGSGQTGGSSGGPFVLNLGVAPVLSGVNFGSASQHNTVVGVTSWGYTDSTVKSQGGSPFTSSNITVLVTAACAGAPAGAC